MFQILCVFPCHVACDIVIQEEGVYVAASVSQGAANVDVARGSYGYSERAFITLKANGTDHFFTSGEWRVYAAPGPGPGEHDETVVVAVPLRAGAGFFLRRFDCAMRL